MTQNKIVGEVILKIRDRKKLAEECLSSISSIPFHQKMSAKWNLYNQIKFLDEICYDLLRSVPSIGDDKDVG